MTDTPPAPELVLRSELPGWLKLMRASAVPLILVAVGLVIRLAVGEDMGMLALPFVALALLIPMVWTLVYLVRRKRFMRLEIIGSLLRFTDWNGKGWTTDRREIAIVQYVNVWSAKPQQEPQQWIFVSNRNGRSNVLWATDWPARGLAMLWKQLEVSVSPETETMWLKELLQRHPDLRLPWWHRRPVAAGLLIGLAAVIYIGIVVTPFAIIYG